MNNSIIFRFYGVVAIIMGVFFIYQNIMSNFILNSPASILWKIVLGAGAILYIICGIGILRHKKWAIVVFLLLMLYFLYTTLFAMYVFAYRISKGGITSIYLELLIFVWLLLSVSLPISTFWIFLRRFKELTR